MKYKTKYILTIIEFDYDSKESRYVPNSIRLSFLGLEGRSLNIPKKIKELAKYEKDIITPIHFSLIKKPVKIDLPGKREYKIKNSAVGAMILYEYLGRIEDLKMVVNAFDELIRAIINKGTPKYFSFITNYDFITGNVWDDPSGT